MSKSKIPATHRISDVKYNSGFPVYITKGDANNTPDAREISPKSVGVVGELEEAPEEAPALPAKPPGEKPALVSEHANGHSGCSGVGKGAGRRCQQGRRHWP